MLANKIDTKPTKVIALGTLLLNFDKAFGMNEASEKPTLGKLVRRVIGDL